MKTTYWYKLYDSAGEHRAWKKDAESGLSLVEMDELFTCNLIELASQGLLQDHEWGEFIGTWGVDGEKEGK